MFISAERIQLREQAIVLRKIGWAQQRIADHIGVPRQTVGYWLSRDMKTLPHHTKFRVGDKVQINGRCPKYLIEQIRRNRVRTVVGLFYDCKRKRYFYTLGSNNWAKSMDCGWVHFFKSKELHKPVEGRGPGRPRKKRRYNRHMKCTVTPSNQNLSDLLLAGDR